MTTPQGHRRVCPNNTGLEEESMVWGGGGMPTSTELASLPSPVYIHVSLPHPAGGPPGLLSLGSIAKMPQGTTKNPEPAVTWFSQRRVTKEYSSSSHKCTPDPRNGIFSHSKRVLANFDGIMHKSVSHLDIERNTQSSVLASTMLHMFWIPVLGLRG